MMPDAWLSVNSFYEIAYAYKHNIPVYLYSYMNIDGIVVYGKTIVDVGYMSGGEIKAYVINYKSEMFQYIAQFNEDGTILVRMQEIE